MVLAFWKAYVLDSAGWSKFGIPPHWNSKFPLFSSFSSPYFWTTLTCPILTNEDFLESVQHEQCGTLKIWDPTPLEFIISPLFPFLPQWYDRILDLMCVTLLESQYCLLFINAYANWFGFWRRADIYCVISSLWVLIHEVRTFLWPLGFLMWDLFAHEYKISVIKKVVLVKKASY